MPRLNAWAPNFGRRAHIGGNSLGQLWGEVDIVELDAQLMAAAADIALRRGLLGYDAVQCAAAVSISDSEVVAAAGDSDLLAAWRQEGVAVADTNTWSR